MHNFSLTKALRVEVQRYRIAVVDLMLEDLPRDVRSRAMTILRTNEHLQMLEQTSVGPCVCQRRRKPPAAKAVARSIATHTFCRAGKVKRTLLMKHDLKRYFPRLFRSGLPAGYYVDTTNEKPVLGLLRVDVHLTPVNRMWHRSVALLEKHRRQPEFGKLIRGHQFEISWVVPTHSKANALRLMASRQQHRSVPVNAQCVEPLLEQLVSRPTTFPDVEGLSTAPCLGAAKNNEQADSSFE